MLYKKTLATLALFSFFSLLSFAEAEESKAYSSAELSFQTSWTILISGNTKPYPLKFAGFIPSNYSHQIVSQASATRPFTLNATTDLAEFELRLTKSEAITLNASVKTDYSETFSEPVAYPVEATPELTEYLRDSPLVIISPEIQAKAEELAAGSNDGIEVSARLVEWVYNNVEYDVKYGDANYSSSWTFENKKGTCDEYAHLLIAMARSIGIPARYASGYVLGVSPSKEYGPTGSLQWVPHGWVELYFPEQGWIPADPTYNELLQLDASHLKLSHSIDQSFLKETVQGTGEAGVSLGLEKTYSIKIIDHKEFTPPIVSIDFPKEANNSIQKTVVLIRNPSNQIIVAPVELVLPGGLQTDSQTKKLVYLKPLEERQIALDARITFQMQNNTKYTFPIEVHTFGKTFQANFTRTTLSEEQPTSLNMTGITQQQLQQAITEIPLDFKLLIGITLLITLILVILAILKARG